MSNPRAADDFAEIRKRMIEIAGPAGNPTQPIGTSHAKAAEIIANYCGNCGTANGTAHAKSCPKFIPPEEYNYYCG